MESNHRPHAYQACALTIWAMSPYFRVGQLLFPLMSFTLFLMYYKVHWKINNRSLWVSPSKGGDPAAPSDTATLLRLHPNHWLYLRLLPRLLAHRLRVFPTLMVWRAVCTRPGNVFTAVCWPAITSNSSFMKANFSLQSELRLFFWVLLHIAISLLFVIAIVVRV